MQKIIKELKEIKEKWREELDKNAQLKTKVAMTESSNASVALEAMNEYRKSENKLNHLRVQMFKLIDLLEET